MIIVNLFVYFSVVLSFVLLPASSSIDADETTLSTNNLDQNNEAAYKCLDPNLLVRQPVRSFLHEGKALELRLEASDRVTHQLSTAVFAIFVKEVLGYPNVTITTRRDAFNVSAVLSRISGCIHETSCLAAEMPDPFVPETAINLEVWLPLGYNLEPWAITGNLEECGLLGPGGRFGWFMPEWTTSYAPFADHWRSLQDPSVASIFDVDRTEMSYISQFTKDPQTGRYYCDASYCNDGVYYPEYCRSTELDPNEPPCAVLLAEYPDYMSFLIKQIPSLRMRVKVIWLGPNADRLVREFVNDAGRRKSGRSIMFFAWRPSTITEDGDFLSLSFPQCETLSLALDNDMRCAYEFQRFEKVAWSHVQKGAKLVFEALQRVFFSQEEYTDMLRLYNQKQDTDEAVKVEMVACEWMRNNTAAWSQWKPADLATKTELFIGGIFPITGPFYTSGRGMIPAAQMAIAAINENDDILKDYEIKLKVADGQCKADMVMKSFIDYLRFRHFNRMAGILGPACSDTVEPIAGVSKHFKTIVISYSAQGSSFSDREKFPYFFRTIGEKRQFKYVFLIMLQQLGWKRVGALMEDGARFSDYVAALQDQAERNNVTFVVIRKMMSNSSVEYLKDLKAKRVRIIVGEFGVNRAREVMCSAFRLNMTAKNGYVWFLPRLDANWYDEDKHHINARTIRTGSTAVGNADPLACTTSQMIQAIDGHFYMTYSNYAPNDTLMQEGISVADWRSKYEEKCAELNYPKSEYASYVYDAVWVYALALNKLLANNHSLSADFHTEHTTQSLRSILNETDFIGVSGRVRFAGGPSRYSDIQVFQWINQSARLIDTFRPVDPQLATKFNESNIKWLGMDGNVPVDDPGPPPAICVLDGLAQLLHVECEVAIVVANVLGFGVFAGLLIVFFFMFKRRYELKVQQTEERMRALGLLSSGTLLTLDEWEIPRERVVINRKLGEGAFGTVYGGEAFFDDKGWVAVAVKTLKVGSTIEEKLDFLSEAEMMKRFNHKNIVSLLGVCTRNEPVYTVMEFILYGDLKTYLLARRHLVYEKSREDSDEISSRRLTSIALDVARALAYLAELKYVHRDVACRNCLVNSNRIAKLADFGMTRPMYENDYYRFHRKGMMPVRWMAPESLMDGLFTPMTDIWSYGVLLYEIITFGSFPFQGLSNNQVLEHVKNGMTIDTPEGVKPQLETLLKSCWHRTPSLRPQAAEIVELLINNTRLVQPCVGIPLSSIQIEGSNSLELELQLPSTVHGMRKSISYGAGHRASFVGKITNGLDLMNGSLGSGNNSEVCGDPLLQQPFPTSHFVTQYITLQHHNSAGENICFGDNGTSQV